MNTVNLQITLPSDVYNAFIQQSLGININDYIVELIKLKLNNKNNLINDYLIEGYEASNHEGEQILSDFSFSDFENWD